MENNVKDKNGLTEQEFLAAYDRTAYDRPSYTADCVLFSEYAEGLVVLTVRRGNHPYINCCALPGGFVNIDESGEDAAARELYEETGIKAELEQLVTVSTPERDPRGPTVTTCYLGTMHVPQAPTAGDDAAFAEWMKVDYIASGDTYKLILSGKIEKFSAELKVVRGSNGKIDLNKTTVAANNGIAFDHAKIILYAIEAL